MPFGVVLLALYHRFIWKVVVSYVLQTRLRHLYYLHFLVEFKKNLFLHFENFTTDCKEEQVTNSVLCYKAYFTWLL